jgi:hypothetical protein
VEALREDQYLAAALLLDTVVATVMARKPDAHPIETEFFLDEYPQYQSDILSTALARSRKFRMTCHFFAQGYFQAAKLLADNLLANTTVKIFGAVDHPDESGRAGKVVHREAPDAAGKQWLRKHRKDRVNLEQMYTSADAWAQAVRDLPNRVFIIKVRGHDAVIVRSVDFTQPYTLRQALEVLRLHQVAELVSAAAADAELQWRDAWIRDGGYRAHWPGYAAYQERQVEQALEQHSRRRKPASTARLTEPAPPPEPAPLPEAPASMRRREELEPTPPHIPTTTTVVTSLNGDPSAFALTDLTFDGDE